MPKQPLFPHVPKRREPLYPHISQGSPEAMPMTTQKTVALIESWLQEWSKQFNIRPPNVRIIGLEGYDVASFDHETYTIVLDPHPLIETIEAHPEALPALKYAVAHEFGHAVMISRHGIEHYLKMHRHAHAQAEDDADNIAEQLTGMTGKEAWNILERHMEYRRPRAVPQAIRKGERTAFYIQYWSPKSAPDISQPYYYSGPEEGGTYKDLNQALRAASDLQQARPNVFDISIYSQVEEWIAEEEDPRYGYWEIVEGTVKGYDMRGALVYDDRS